MREVGGVTFRESNCNGIVTIKDVCSGGLFTIAEPLSKVVDVSGVATNMHFKKVPIQSSDIFCKQCDVCSTFPGTKTSLNDGLVFMFVGGSLWPSRFLI